ncbi:MAG: helix-turn-helix domain-containing protein [Acidimicrobiia bacterium]
MHQLEPLLSTQELAEFLHVPIATIYAWRYRQQGPPGFRVGRHLRYRRSDVEEWISHQLEDSGHHLDPAPRPNRR